MLFLFLISSSVSVSAYTFFFLKLISSLAYLSKFFVSSYKLYSTHPRLAHTTSRESLLSTFHPSLFHQSSTVPNTHTGVASLPHSGTWSTIQSINTCRRSCQQACFLSCSAPTRLALHLKDSHIKYSVTSLKYAFIHSYQSCSSNKSPYFQINSTVYHLPTGRHRQVQSATKQDHAGGLRLRSEQSHREGGATGGLRRGLL